MVDPEHRLVDASLATGDRRVERPRLTAVRRLERADDVAASDANSKSPRGSVRRPIDCGVALIRVAGDRRQIRLPPRRTAVARVELRLRIEREVVRRGNELVEVGVVEANVGFAAGTRLSTG